MLFADVDWLGATEPGEDVEDLGMAGGRDLGEEDEFVHLTQAYLRDEY